jgi:hypothetical protein
VLQVATHLALSQFRWAPLRCLMDLATLTRAEQVDWTRVAERAEGWRVATMLWTVLDLAHRLIGLPGTSAIRTRLRPSSPRRSILNRYVSPRSLLRGATLTAPASRYALMLMLVDRFADASRLVWRTAWPEKRWLAARYREPVGHLRHLWGLLRSREV